MFFLTFVLMSTKWSSRCLIVFSKPTRAWTWRGFRKSTPHENKHFGFRKDRIEEKWKL
jgi:hypothetical protein